MSSANETQVGGEHYKRAVQHWDVAALHDIPYLEARALAYLLRYKHKGRPKEDLQKCRHFVQKIRELHALGVYEPRVEKGKTPPTYVLEELSRAHELEKHEMEMVFSLVRWFNVNTLDELIAQLKVYVDRQPDTVFRTVIDASKLNVAECVTDDGFLQNAGIDSSEEST